MAIRRVSGSRWGVAALVLCTALFHVFIGASAQPLRTTPVTAPSPVSRFSIVVAERTETKSPVTAMAVSPDARFLVSGHADRTINIRDGSSLRLLFELGGLPTPATSLAISADGSLAIAVVGGAFWLVDTATGSSSTVVLGDGMTARDVAAATSSSVIALLTNASVDLVDARSLSVFASLNLTVNHSPPKSIGLSPDATHIAIGARAGGSTDVLYSYNVVADQFVQLGRNQVLGVEHGVAVSPGTPPSIAAGFTLFTSDARRIARVDENDCRPGNLSNIRAERARFSSDGRLLVQVLSYNHQWRVLDVRDAATGLSLSCFGPFEHVDLAGFSHPFLFFSLGAEIYMATLAYD